MFRAASRQPGRGGSWKGTALIAAIFLFGASVLLTLYMAPRTTDVAPATAVWGVPASDLRALSLDMGKQADATDRVRDAVALTQASLVFVQNVRIEDVEPLGRAIGMSRVGGDVYYPSQNTGGANAPYGCAIYSVFPLYESRSIPNKSGSFGVWATGVIGGKKFVVASAAFSSEDDPRSRETAAFSSAWKELGSPPMVLGVCGLPSIAPLHSTQWVTLLDPVESSGATLVATRHWQRGPLVGLDSRAGATLKPGSDPAP